MKGAFGLLIAAGLGLAAGIFNFAYLNLRAREMRPVAYVGIKPDLTINAGEKLREEHIQEVPMPQNMTSGLDHYGVRWSSRFDALNQPVAHAVVGPRLLLEEDFRTPATQGLLLGPGEYGLGIPVDARTSVPALIEPGQTVSFLVSRGRGPTPAAGGGNYSDAASFAATGDEPTRSRNGPQIFGPFRVLSVGNRLGSAEVQRAARLPQLQENVMMIAVKLEEGRLEPRAEELLRAVQASDARGVQVLYHSTANP